MLAIVYQKYQTNAGETNMECPDPLNGDCDCQDTICTLKLNNYNLFAH